jgi:chloramphenicol 3-O phosphotransferase
VTGTGRIVILNGAPRSGKTSIARVLQKVDTRNWLNIGVDAQIATLPETLKPGIGLRPGGERPDLERIIPTLYAALFDSISATARLGLDVVADVGIHDSYSQPLDIWGQYAECLGKLNPLLVGLRCSLEENLRRRDASGESYAGTLPGGSVSPFISLWEDAVHRDVEYDLELRTDELSPEECATRVLRRLSQA